MWLGTWHTFVIFDTAEHDKGLKRLMRDFVHYTEAMMQLAAHSVGQLGGIGSYTALHIRRVHTIPCLIYPVSLDDLSQAW